MDIGWYRDNGNFDIDDRGVAVIMVRAARITRVAGRKFLMVDGDGCWWMFLLVFLGARSKVKGKR